MRDDFKIVDYDAMPMIDEGMMIPGIREKANGQWTSRIEPTIESTRGRYHGEWSRVSERKKGSEWLSSGTHEGFGYDVEVRRYLGGKLDSAGTSFMLEHAPGTRLAR